MRQAESTVAELEFKGNSIESQSGVLKSESMPSRVENYILHKTMDEKDGPSLHTEEQKSLVVAVFSNFVLSNLNT